MSGYVEFDLADARELWEHAQASPEFLPMFDEQITEPGLLLVKDQGVYLMSNGEPCLQRPGAEEGHSKVVYAEGFDPERADIDAWYDSARHICGGDDFSELLDRELCEQLFAERAATRMRVTFFEETLKFDLLAR